MARTRSVMAAIGLVVGSAIVAASDPACDAFGTGAPAADAGPGGSAPDGTDGVDGAPSAGDATTGDDGGADADVEACAPDAGLGGPCTSNTCCQTGLSCHLPQGTCVPCIANGSASPCKSGAECCSGSCVSNGVCAATCSTTTCTAGAPKTCCIGLACYTDGSCKTCLPSGAPCQDDPFACCSGACLSGATNGCM